MHAFVPTIVIAFLLAGCGGTAAPQQTTPLPAPSPTGANAPPTPPPPTDRGNAASISTGPNCGMREAFMAIDANSPGGRAPVWGPAGDPASGPAFFAARLNVNTDGTPRSYSVDDPTGRQFALNNVCNAMQEACRELDRAGRERRFAQLRQARDQNWPADLLAATRLSAQIIPRRADGRVCPEIERDGRRYLVSSTSLVDRQIADGCRIERYIDALSVPALVLQGGRNGLVDRGVRVGDAVVAWRQGMTSPVYAVVGDTGPADRLGEGSVALNGALLGRTGEPANYNQLIREYVVPKAYVLIFPGSRDAARPRTTADRVFAAAREALSAWGGGSEAGGFARLKSCASALDGG